MHDLTLEEKRAVASLKTITGYRILLDKVVKCNQEDALVNLKLSHGSEQIIEAALRFRVWDDVLKLLHSAPEIAKDELAAEGDAIYG